MSLPEDTWVVVPSYNEANVLRENMTGLLSVARHVVVVDDGSTDNTGQALAGLSVHYLRHAVNLGQGAALQTGIDYALRQGASIVVTFDADGQMRPEEIGQLCRALHQHKVDVALGSRFLADGSKTVPPGRRAVLKLATRITRWTTGLQLTDTHNGSRALTRRAARALRLRQNRMAHASEILHLIRQHDLSFVEVPVRISYTAYSRGKGQSALDAFDILWDLNFR